MINWRYLDSYISSFAKILLFVVLAFYVVLGILMDFGSSIDVWGHIGGLIFGFFILPVISKPVQQNDGVFCSYKYWNWLCISVIAC